MNNSMNCSIVGLKDVDQAELIIEYLAKNDASRNELVDALNIRTNSVNWRVDFLIRKGKISVVRKGKCKFSRSPVQLLTSDPKKFPSSTQLQIW